MESLINLDSVNSYSKLEYNSKNSVLDAAFYLLNNSNFTYTEEDFEYINSFIIFIYSIICITLIAQSDDGMLNLAGDFTDVKIFAYNLIYMYDNIDDYNENYIGLYNNNDFNYIIDDFIINRDEENQQHSEDNDYSNDLVTHVEEAYMDNSLLIQTEVIQDSNLKDWQICLYLTVYYFILLVNDINNTSRKTGPFILLKILKYILLICYSINTLTILDENDETEFFDFLENNSYFSNMYTKIFAFFFNIDEGVEFKYDIFNYLLEIISDPDIVLEATQSLSTQILVVESIETTNNLYNALGDALINLNLYDPYIDAQRELQNIKADISREYNCLSLKTFYENVLFTISETESINNDIINDITEPLNQESYVNNEQIVENLENVFDTFIYNFLFYKTTEDYRKNIKYLCDSINNIYKNKQLYNVFWDILFNTQHYAEYFFQNKINFYRKSLLIEGINNLNSDEEDEENNCYVHNEEFNFKNLQKLNSDENDFEFSDNLQIGHSVLGRKYNLQISLTRKLFFTDVCYCGDNISLENFPAFFYNNEC
jgi:hypothetical protein